MVYELMYRIKTLSRTYFLYIVMHYSLSRSHSTLLKKVIQEITHEQLQTVSPGRLPDILFPGLSILQHPTSMCGSSLTKSYIALNFITFRSNPTIGIVRAFENQVTRRGKTFNSHSKKGYTLI